jgi:hypothetical protein
MLIEFSHKAPKGYSYVFEDFKRNITAIWIVNHSHFNYCGKSDVLSIWGFWNSKTKEYHAPINSKTVGECVNITDTTPYSAMIPNLTPLERCIFQR